MSLTSNLIVSLGVMFTIFVISQLIYLAMRMHRSVILNRQRECQRQRLGINIQGLSCNEIYNNRQNTVELGRQHSRYGDIFYIEPNSQEAARIREQLEKDEKELPSYDEVMQMCNLTMPTAAAMPSTPPPPMELNPIGIAALPVPPYSESDPNPTLDAERNTASSLEPAPSTSRAAQIAT